MFYAPSARELLSMFWATFKSAPRVQLADSASSRDGDELALPRYLLLPWQQEKGRRLR